MGTSLIKKIYLLIIAFLVIGVICGIIFLNIASEDAKEIIFLNINNYILNMSNNHVNNILLHLIVLSSLVISSFFIIGIPISMFYLFYNGFSIGFIVSSFINIFGINGFIYGLIYVIITKGLFIILCSILTIYLIKISKLIIDKVVNKISIKDKIYYLLIKCIIIIGIVLLIDVLLYFFGIPILNIFKFLLN